MPRLFPVACVLLLMFAGSSRAGGFVYLAQSPGDCSLPDGNASDAYSVFIHSGDYADITGVSFRLECERFTPAQITALTVPPGVTIVSGSLFGGIVLAFDGPRSFAHDAVLTVQVSDQEMNGSAMTRDVILQRGATPLPVDGVYTFGWPFDCVATITFWDAPDTVSVTVGKDDSFPFRALVTMPSYPPNATVSIADPEGWVVTPFSNDVFADCEHCPWDWTTVTVPTHVPPGVAHGALNPITLEMSSFGGSISERTIVLRAIQPVPVEHRTIGGVKALYR